MVAWAPRLPPAVSGSGVRCGLVCWARVSAVSSPSWLGFRGLFFALFFLPSLSWAFWSLFPHPLSFGLGCWLFFFFFFFVCYSPPLLAWFRCRWWWAVPATPGWGPLAAVVCAVWFVVCGVLVGLWLVCGVVGPSPLLAVVPVCYSPPLLAGFRSRWWWAVPATPGWGPLAAVVCGVWCVVCGVWCVAVVCWWGCGWCVVWLVPRLSWRGFLCATPRHSWLDFAAGGGGRSPPLLAGVGWRRWCVVCGVWCMVCWWGCGWCVVWLVPRLSWRGFLCATPRHSWLGFAAGGGGRSPPLLAGVRWRRWCVVCGVWWWCVGGVVAGVWCCRFLATLGGGSCVLLPATPGWVSLPVVVGGPRHSWLGSAGGGGVWCVVCGGGVLVGLWLVCGVVGPSPILAEVPVCYSPPLLAGLCCRWWWVVPATPGWGPLAAVVYGVWCVGGACGWCVVWLVPRLFWRWFLCATSRRSWLGFAAGGGGRSPPLLAGVPCRRWCVVCGVWCVVCGGVVLVGLWLVCGVVGPSPLLAGVPVCYSPPLLAGFRCRWWWAVPATPGWGPLAAVMCGVWFVVCGGGVLVGLWLVYGVVGPSPLLAEVPVGYSPALLAGFRCRWWWAVPATPGWGPLAAVVCGVWRWCVGGVVAGVWCRWSLAIPGGGFFVPLPATPGWVSLPVVGGPRRSWLGSAGGGGVCCVVCGVWRWCVGGVVAGVWCGWSLATPGGGSCVLLSATPGWDFAAGGGGRSPPLLAGVRWRRWCVVCGVWRVAVVRWWGCGWCVVWLVPRHSWQRFPCATPRHSWLSFAAGGGGRSLSLLAGVRWLWWCVVCGVWCVAVVCWWGCGWCVVWLVPRCVCLSLGALILGLGVCAFVSCGFCRFRSVLCAVCCAVLCVPGCGAALRCCVLCRSVLCCCVLCCFAALGWCRCSSCRALWCSPSPWGLVLCSAPFCGVPPRCVCFVVACWCVLLFAALLCAVCVLGFCAVRSLSSLFGVVLCFAVLVRLRCAVRVVRAVTGARCCGALPCVVLFPLVCCLLVLGLVARGCLLVPCCGALLSVLLCWWCWFVSFPCVYGAVLRCASCCLVPVASALLLVPRAVACPWVLWCLPGRSAVWWCRSGVSWCLAVLCVVLWCPAPCAVSSVAVLPCGVVLVGCAVRLSALLVFVFPFVLFSFAKYPCCFSLPLKTFC